MLAAPEHRGRDERIGLAVCLRLQKCDNCQFTDIKLRFAYQWLERRVRHFHVGEFKVDDVGSHLPVPERHRIRIVSEQRI